MCRRILFCALSTLLTCSPALGQSAEQDTIPCVAEAALKVRTDQWLRVTTRSGAVSQGRLVAIDTAKGELSVLEANSEVGLDDTIETFSHSDIQEIEYKESGHFKLWWMTIGFVGGSLAGAAVSGVAGLDQSGYGISDAAIPPLIGMGAGMLAGLIVPPLLPTTRSIECGPLPQQTPAPLEPATLQASSAPRRPDGPGCVCFRGRPAPRCCIFWIFEPSLKVRTSESNVRPGKGNGLFTLDLGLMKNIGRRNALGATFYIDGDDDASRMAFRPRYRRWLDNDFALDISPGIMFSGQDNKSRLNFPGYVGTVAISYASSIALTLEVESIEFDNRNPAVYYWGPGTVPLSSGRQTALYAGFAMGSGAGVVGLLVGIVGTGILYAATS